MINNAIGLVLAGLVKFPAQRDDHLEPQKPCPLVLLRLRMLAADSTHG